MALLRSLLTRRSSIRRRSCGCWPGLSRACSAQADARVVLSWVDFHHWLARTCARHPHAGRRRHSRAARYLIAVKHQSMFETLEMVRLAQLPVIVMKRELADIPLFGWLTRRYGVIAVERRRGAKALRTMVAAGQGGGRGGAAGDDLPEGTRVRAWREPAAEAGLRRPLPRARPASGAGRGRQREAMGPGLGQAHRHGDFPGRRSIPPGLRAKRSRRGCTRRSTRSN